ncbi:ABC transporter substrate-binding protein [Egbenema bharatensis]|uniref:ABC transporter substrate-binding protein n=1 Tax=Egbenema bharatensis TaxID=3463334 RepID=UPI003A898F8C
MMRLNNNGVFSGFKLRQIQRILLWILLIVVSAAFASACNGISSRNSASSRNETASQTEVRVISHAVGTTEIPANPQRIVTLDSTSLESALAIGVTPIGTINTDWTHLQSDLTGVENIGITGEPNLEKTLSLRPDLILGNTYHQAIYPQASQIAPTVLAPFESSADWKTVFALVSEALGQSDAHDQFMADYEARLAEFKAKMGNRLQTLEVSVITVPADGRITVYLDQTFAGTIVRDAGLQRPPSQRHSGFSERLSRERMQDIDADVIFLWNSALPGEDDQEINAAVTQLKQDPLWQQLNAVQTNRVYEVPYYWIGPGPIAANLVIDDLFQSLLKEEVIDEQEP